MGLFNFKKQKTETKTEPRVVGITPGRVSIPENGLSTIYTLRNQSKLITPNFRFELIPIIRDLVKSNPDVSIAVQDMYKLTNTGHHVQFPYNSDGECEEMQKYLTNVVSQKWGKNIGGVNGIVNRMVAQVLVGGAISIEAAPSQKLDGIDNIIFIKPETIYFERNSDGGYKPFQRASGLISSDFVELNSTTFTYAPLINDVDEPYGIPPFIAALDSLSGQHTMKNNFKFIMEQAGLLGFLEAKLTKPDKLSSESLEAYRTRLEVMLKKFKSRIVDGMSDGVVVGYDGDHEFKLNSTSKDISNFDKPWNLNQQSVANGLGVSGSIIGLNNASTEGGQGILLSKMISQLTSLQNLLSYVLVKLYTLELQLAGYKCKGVTVKFGSSTVSDELKSQQGLEIKLRNLTTLYNQGIISQADYAWLSGYTKPDKTEPRVKPKDTPGSDDPLDKKKREADKDKSDRRGRDKKKIVPKRQDQKPKER